MKRDGTTNFVFVRNEFGRSSALDAAACFAIWSAEDRKDVELIVRV